jgi:Fe-S oxidoreductase
MPLQRGYGYLFGYIGTLNRWGSLFSNVSNSILHSSLSKWLLSKIGITAHRDLPLLAKEQFSTWARKNLNQDKSRPKIVLFNDTYTEFNFPEIGQAAVKVLEALGYHVIVPAWQCCGRPLLSKGLLSQSQKKAKELLETLTPYAKEGLPIIGLEPSCILTLKDDFESLCGEKAHTLAHACITFDEFLNNHLKEGRLPLHFSSDACQVLVHGHCHQKSLVGIEPTLNVLRAVPGFEVSEIKSGCCGVAGSFGYEKEHYAFSMQIGELHLLPTLRKASIEALVVADGTSCRSQIHHGTNRTAKHLAEVLADRLIDLPLT